MADADTIHRVAELLYAASVEHITDHLTAFSGQLDMSTNVVYKTFTLAICHLPEDVQHKMDDSVERNVIAYLADLSILCKVIETSDFGRAFHLSMPGEYQVLEHFGQRSGDARMP